MRRLGALALVLAAFFATPAFGGIVCRDGVHYEKTEGGYVAVPDHVCITVPDPPPPAPPPPDSEAAVRALKAKCELYKSAYGEEKGRAMCQALIEGRAP